jgi:hypothetical protein
MSPGVVVTCSLITVCVLFQLHGAVLKELDKGQSAARLDCKESAESLFIPEKEDACAHGDANLAVDDFMKRIRAD